jgi:hypothetical protein
MSIPRSNVSNSKYPGSLVRAIKSSATAFLCPCIQRERSVNALRASAIVHGNRHPVFIQLYECRHRWYSIFMIIGTPRL